MSKKCLVVWIIMLTLATALTVVNLINCIKLLSGNYDYLGIDDCEMDESTGYIFYTYLSSEDVPLEEKKEVNEILKKYTSLVYSQMS